MRALFVTPLIALVLGLCGCSRSSDTLGATLEELRAPGAPVTSLSESAIPQILHPSKVRHSGTRLVEVFGDQGELALSYRESVSTNGDGNFSLLPIEALTDVESAWNLLQIARQRYLFRHRDFSIRNERLFLKNYRLSVTGAEAIVAGRVCDRYRVERRNGSTGISMISVDVDTRLLLASEEYAPGGELLVRMQYESFDADPDLSAAIWFQSSHEETDLGFAGAPMNRAGQAVPLPRVLPEGFFLEEAMTLWDGTAEWMRLTFTDGVEPLFYLYQSPANAEQEGKLGTAGASAQQPEVYLHRMGAAGVAQATLEQGTFIVVGKLAEDDLVTLIESALP